jgi:[ribosomal protein S5]-alanine N-acetyltransferase
MILTTERLVLRPQQAGDAPALFTILRDPEAMRFWSQPAITRLQVVEGLIAEQEVAVAEGQCRYWTVMEAGDAIGSVDLSLIREGSAELGFLVRPDRWGLGLGSEAASAVADHGLTRMGLKRLAAAVQAENIAAARVLEKAGFRQIESREVLLPSGQQRVCAFYLRER